MVTVPCPLGRAAQKRAADPGEQLAQRLGDYLPTHRCVDPRNFQFVTIVAERERVACRIEADFLDIRE